MYTPLDYWPIMRRAFSVIRPARIVLVEAEVWPNLAAAAHARRIPLALVNARLSPRSERRYRRFRFFVAPMFRLLDLVCVPERRDIERWTALGVPRNRIHVTGSIKFDPDVQTQSHTVAASPKFDEASDAIQPGFTRALRRQHASWRRRNPGQSFSSVARAISVAAVVHRAASCRTAARNPRAIGLLCHYA